jgi:molecular chaperone HscB
MSGSNKTETAERAPAAETSCWSCGAMRAAHFCEACGKVQPARPVDYFAFFGLPRKLNVNVGELEREFYRLSRKLHPDLYVNRSREEQSWSLQKSSMLNDAYRTLKDPVTRTQYLLKLEGVQLEEQSQAATTQARQSGTQKQQAVPPEMLEEVFDLNMQLEEARLERTTGELDDHLRRDLEQKKQDFENRLQELAGELKGYWDQWDGLIAREEAGEPIPEPERHQVRDRMVDLLNRRSYIRNLVRDVNEVLE